MNCCICKKEIFKYPHNANPLMEGRCCKECNNKFVIPFRIFLLSKEKPTCALLLKPQYVLEVLEPKKEYFTLEEKQKAVAGNIAIAPERMGDCFVVVNEEGALRGMPPNLTGYNIFGWKYLGNILIVPEKIFEAPEEE
ncbi:MAG: DUF3846 domain-containing protein [Anaeroplasmataceae bacterium]|nr:DUF3846 domain-containing protein [Anaeroplasmataceae bacterium]